LERIEGGFVRARRVRLLTPSHLQGEVQPHLPMAFVIRNIHAPGKMGAIAALRYDRFPVQEIDGAKVATNRGPLPRSALRIVTLQSPPSSIPTGAKWVLVDISQQTLTAYEGEIAVYATLISSGKDHKESDTHAGLYQVGHKLSYSDMHGEPDDPYSVDRVPYTLYFNKDEALHGAYWHDRFGWPTSHGCINLALADAHWLFEWAPPRLPESWNTIDPMAAGLSSLWVFVKEKAALNRLPQFSSADAAQKVH
jgi:lipoprotein-anchoring transpeptidase ErfK/SrfK